MRRVEKYHQNKNIKVNNLKISNKALKTLAIAAVVLVVTGAGIKISSLKTKKFNPETFFQRNRNSSGAVIQRQIPEQERDLMSEYNQKRTKELIESGAKFDKERYDILQNMYYTDGWDLSPIQSVELYDQELLFEQLMIDLPNIDTSEFSPFRYWYLHERNENLSQEQLNEYNKQKELKVPYDYQKLMSLKSQDFSVDDYGVLRLKQLEKTLLDDEARRLYDLELIKPRYDVERLHQLDKTYNRDIWDRSNELMDKWVRGIISPEEYRENYDLWLVRKNFEKQQIESKGRGK